MSSLEYSIDALNVLNKFHRVETIVHVEGDDDVVFWSAVFEMFTDRKIEFLPSGSCTELDKKIRLIEEGQIASLAARDSDYLVFKSDLSEHPKVIYTYGHSIENSLHYPCSINTVTKIVCRTGSDQSELCKEWLNQFSESTLPLLCLEIANEIAGTGIAFLGNNCSRYMKGSGMAVVCKEKVETKLTEALPSIPIEARAEAEEIVAEVDFDVRRWLRGHFLASGVQQFISTMLKKTGRKGSVAYENLFGQSIICLRAIFEANPEEKNYYKNKIEAALANVA